MNSHDLTRPNEKVTTRRLPIAAALLFISFLGFYLYTLQPSLAWGDGTKLQVEAFTGQSFILADLPDAFFQNDSLPFARLGVAAWDHPLYVMLGYTLVKIFPGFHAPWLINTISALFGAGTITLLFLLGFSFTGSFPAALLAAVSVGVSHTFWFHAVTPEVYTLLAFILLLSLFLLNKFEQTSRYLYLFLSLFVFGLGAANHVLTFLTVPALLAYRILSRSTPPILPRRPLKLLGAGLAFLIGFSPFLIQFIRMLSVFSITEVFGPVIGSVFLTELLSLTPRLFLTSILTYLILLFFQFNPLALLLGGFGLLRGRQVSGANWLKVTAFFGVFTTFGILYRVTDQFAFFLISHLFFGILIAFGLAYAISRIKASNHAKLIYAMGLLTLGMPLLYGLIPKIAPSVGLTDETLEIPQIGTGTRDGFAYYVNPNKRGDQAAYRFGQEFYARAPQDALIIAEWYTDTDEYFVLQYFSRVESLRPDIEVMGWPMENPFTFDADIAVALIAEQVSNRPVYLASLSDTFYSASALSKKYCIIPELNLYRVYPAGTLAKIPASRCLAIAGS